jgi:hypothetical protein
MYLIVGISISAFLLLGTLVFLMIFYFRKKQLYEKSKNQDKDLRKIDFDQKNEFLDN